MKKLKSSKRVENQITIAAKSEYDLLKIRKILGMHIKREGKMKFPQSDISWLYILTRM